MKIKFEVSETNFTLEGQGFHEESGSSLEILIEDIAQFLQAYLEADADLKDNHSLEDGSRRAVLAIQLKMEIMAKDISTQSKCLKQLRDGTLSPTDVGFPEFDFTDY